MRPTLPELYAFLNSHGARYLVIGGVAVGVHGYPRVTLDLDLTIEPTLTNAEAVLTALREVGLGTAFLIEPQELLAQQITIFQDLVRVDVQTQTPGIDFESAWARRDVKQIEGVPVNIVSLEDLIASKQAAGRPQDLEDLEVLRRIQRGEV
jgi:predicted nucleotidyltransferase